MAVALDNIMNSFRSALAIIVAISGVAGFLLGGVPFQMAPSQAESVVSHTDGDDRVALPAVGENRASVEWSRGRDSSNANADKHWHKHGREFAEDTDAQEYESKAWNFVHHPPPGAEIKHRANGDTLLYDLNTNTFAVENRDGEPRTMFKPARGRAYWERQR